MVSWRPVSMAILTLVPTPSVAATSTGSVKPAPLEVEQAAEAADFGVGAGARGGAHQRLDQLHHPVAGVDIDARLRVSEPALLFCHAGPSFAPGSYVENASRAMVRRAVILRRDRRVQASRRAEPG